MMNGVGCLVKVYVVQEFVFLIVDQICKNYVDQDCCLIDFDFQNFELLGCIEYGDIKCVEDQYGKGDEYCQCDVVGDGVVNEFLV